jgi:translation initiation factor eIF-2B subunit gamma
MPIFSHISRRNASDVTQFVGIDASNSQLVYLNNSDDMDSDEFSLRMSLLAKHPVLNVSRLLQDAHLYVFKRWVVELIVEVANKRTMASIKGHVLPLLVKSQHQRVLADREGVSKSRREINMPESFSCTCLLFSNG